MRKFWKAAMASAVLLCAGVAQATTVKFIDFVATTSANPRVHGVASMSYDSCQDTTHASVELHNLDRNTNYVVYVASDGPGTLGQVTTNNGGNASFSGDFPQDATTQNPAVYVFAGTIDTFTTGDLRAEAVGASFALALFTDFDATTSETPNVDGLGTMLYEASCNGSPVTHVAVVVVRLLPNTAYVIYAASNGNGVLADVTTDRWGIAHYQGDVAGDITVNGPAFYVFKGTTSTITTPDLRAQAFPVN